MPVELLQQGFQQGEDLDVAVVAGRLLAIGLQVERVDDVDVVQVRGRGLVGEVDRVLQREVPDREGLELRVAGGHAAAELVIDLREAGGELAGTWSRRGDDDEVAGGFHVVIEAEAAVGDHELGIRRVAGDHPVARDLKAEALQALGEGDGHVIAILQLGQHHVVDQETAVTEDVDEAEGVLLVGDGEVGADLAALQVTGIEADDDLDVFLDVLQHRDLVIRREAGQDAGGVVVVEELAAHFEVEFPTDLLAPLVDVLGLELDVLLAVETDAVGHGRSLFLSKPQQRWVHRLAEHHRVAVLRLFTLDPSERGRKLLAFPHGSHAFPRGAAVHSG